MVTKVKSRSQVFDAGGWHRILTSFAFGTATVDLRKTFVYLIKKLFVKKTESTSSLESLVACRLIPIDKKFVLETMSVGEILRRIASKTVMMLFKNDVNLIVAGKIADIKLFGNRLTEIGPSADISLKLPTHTYMLKKFPKISKEHAYWHEHNDHNQREKYFPKLLLEVIHSEFNMPKNLSTIGTCSLNFCQR